jgi:hypothetical protein
MNQKHIVPFKFNHAWLNEESFKNIVMGNYKGYVKSSGFMSMQQLSNNLIHIKRKVVDWVRERLKSNQKELNDVGSTLHDLFE